MYVKELLGNFLPRVFLLCNFFFAFILCAEVCYRHHCIFTCTSTERRDKHSGAINPARAATGGDVWWESQSPCHGSAVTGAHRVTGVGDRAQRSAMPVQLRSKTANPMS